MLEFLELPEFKVMRDLKDLILFEKNSNPFSLSEEKMQKRVGLFKLNFETRTKKTLEKFFPKTKESLNPSEWEFFGKKYSYEIATQFINLNEIPKRFFIFLKKHTQNQLALKWAQLESALFESRLLPHYPALQKEDLLFPEKLFDAHLQPSFELLLHNKDTFAVCTGQISPALSQKLISLLTDLKMGTPLEEGIANHALDTCEVTEFFVLATTYQWLYFQGPI